MSWKNLAIVAAFLAFSTAEAQDSTAWSKFQLNADEAPKQTPWTEAASLSLVSGDGEDSIDVDLAARYDWQAFASGADTFFVSGLVKANDRSKTQEETYKLGAGYHWEFGGRSPDQAFGFSDVSIAYQQNKVFEDTSLTQCTTDPSQVFCRDQQETKLVATYSTSIIPSSWESSTPVLYFDDNGNTIILDDESPAFLYSVSPVVSVFYDDILDAATDPKTGQKIDGRAVGTSVVLGAYFSPRWLDYRIELKSSYKQSITFDRDESRKPGFSANADLFSASANYNFGKPSILSGTGWQPSIGVTYSSGEDPSAGRKEKEETTIAFKLAYKAG